MIKQILILLLSLAIFTCCHSSKKMPVLGKSVKMYPLGKKGMWGYADENGEVAIDYHFEEVTFFRNGFAAAKQNGKYGFINQLGEFTIKPKYDSIAYFGVNKANVYKNGKSFTIDMKGKKLKKGILIGRCGAGMPALTSNPLDFFNLAANKYSLNEKEFAQQKRLDPSAQFTSSDFTFDNVIRFSDKSLIVIKSNKYGIFVHYNSVGLKEFWADEIIPFYQGKDYIGNLKAARYATYRIGNKWGLISDLGHIQLEPEFYSIEKSTGMYYLVEFKPDHWGCMTLSNKYFNYEIE